MINTHAADICRVVIDDKRASVSDLADEIGATKSACEAVVSYLCREGILIREGEWVRVANQQKAMAVAVGAKKPPPALLSETPQILASKPKAPKAPRAEIPVPTDLKIEKGVPIPPAWLGMKRKPCLWPFALMDVGDSFATPVPENLTAKDVTVRLNRDISNFRRYGKREWRAVIRAASDGTSVRVWRAPDAEAKPNEGMTLRSVAARAGRKAA